MGIIERKDLIIKLEEKLNARVLTLVTGDRQGMETKIAPDILPLISEHLSHIGATETIALFIYTPGGDTIAGWGLVNLLREYCNKLKVVVPFRALSCGTLITLGADEIIDGRHGLLSPVDPSVGSPFNPQAPGSTQQGVINLLPVSVEDMSGFLELARKEIGLNTNESKTEVLKILADKIHPLALGAVYRAREQTHSLAKRLLMKHSTDENKVNQIVKLLTQELPTHSYLIGRSEAKEIGLKIVEPSEEVEQLMWALYKDYENWMHFTSPASAEQDLGTESQKIVRYERAALESLNGGSLFRHVFITDKTLFKMQTTSLGMQQPIDQIMERVVYQGWIVLQNGEVIG